MFLSYIDGPTIRHGGDGVGLSELLLKESEYIVSVEVWIGVPSRFTKIDTFGVSIVAFEPRSKLW